MVPRYFLRKKKVIYFDTLLVKYYNCIILTRCQLRGSQNRQLNRVDIWKMNQSRIRNRIDQFDFQVVRLSLLPMSICSKLFLTDNSIDHMIIYAFVVHRKDVIFYTEDMFLTILIIYFLYYNSDIPLTPCPSRYWTKLKSPNKYITNNLVSIRGLVTSILEIVPLSEIFLYTPSSFFIRNDWLNFWSRV